MLRAIYVMTRFHGRNDEQLFDEQKIVRHVQNVLLAKPRVTVSIMTLADIA